MRHRKHRPGNGHKGYEYLGSLQHVSKPKDGRCTECRQIKPLTRHHKIPKSENGPNALTNIEWLCRDCHDKRHGIVRKVIDRMEGVNA